VSPFGTCGASGTPIGIFSDIRNELKKIVSLIFFFNLMIPITDNGLSLTSAHSTLDAHGPSI
jgi:hypothetical protein